MKTFVYTIVSFILDNWKGTVKIIISIYCITLGLTLLAGANPGFAVPLLNLTVPTI